MTFLLGPRAISAGYRLLAFDHIGSTNAEAMAVARSGEQRAEMVRHLGADGGTRAKKPPLERAAW